MKEQWRQWAARYDALAARERWLIAAAVLAGMVLLGYSLLIDPALKRWQLAERSLIDQQAQLDSVHAQSLALQSAQRNPDLAASAEVASLKQQLGELSARLASVESSLVPPRRMAGLLEEMIGRKSGLRLLGLKTLVLAPVLVKKTGTEETGKAVDKSATPGLFKHGIEIRLEGSYQDLSAYLERLEQSKLKLLWSSASLAADGYPKLVLTLTVYTVSLDSAWLIV
jgi:MSHA biogenesis protein MshJ